MFLITFKTRTSKIQSETYKFTGYIGIIAVHAFVFALLNSDFNNSFQAVRRKLRVMWTGRNRMGMNNEMNSTSFCGIRVTCLLKARIHIVA